MTVLPRLTIPLLTALALLTTLPLLTALLAGLPLATLQTLLAVLALAVLTILTVRARLAILAIERVAVEIAVNGFEAIAQILDAIESSFRSLILAVGRALLRLVNLLAQLGHARENLLFDFVVGGNVARPQTVGTALDFGLEVVLVQAAEGLTQLARRVAIA